MRQQLSKSRIEIIKDDHRFKVLACGRRWGKTYLALYWLHQGPIQPRVSRWFVAPTYRQAKMIAWPILRELYSQWDWIDKVKFNHTELSVQLPNEAVITLKGADSPDSLRGIGLNRVVMDEFAFMKPEVWSEIIRPALSDTGGDALFIGTPDGHNHFFDVYQQGQDVEFADWQSWQYTTVEGGYVPADEVAAARNDMDARTFRQEYEATFETVGNRVYDAFNRERNVESLQMPGARVIAGMDFNVAKMCCAVGWLLPDGIHWFDEIVLKDSNTFEMAQVLAERYPRCTVYPDPAGSGRRSSSTRSDHQILRDAGFSVIAPRAHPLVKDRINAVNGLWYNAAGRVRMTVDPKCEDIIANMLRVQWHQGEPDKRQEKRGYVHMSDAIGYATHYLFPVVRREAKEISRW